MDLLNTLKKKAIKKKNISAAEALELFVEGTSRPYRVLASASEIREHFKGKEIILCGMTHAKSGRCAEDCKFCAQSSHFATDISSYPLKTAGQIVAEAVQAKKNGAEYFGIVTSGRQINTKKEWSVILKAVKGIHQTGVHACASLGMINVDQARELKAAGLFRYHHNLETAPGYFKNICTTHEYAERIETLRVAKAAGLSVCAGAVFGMGEGITHRIELAVLLRNLGVDSIPIYLLNPVKGTPLDHMRLLPPMEILMTIAVFRFMLPDKDIKLCDGKEKSLRQLLPLGMIAGANALMTGSDLMSAGRGSQLDHEMIADLGLLPTREFDPCRCDEESERGCSASPAMKGAYKNSGRKSSRKG